VPEQRQGVRELQEALRSLEKRAKTAQRADGHPYSRREAAKQANAAPFHAGGLDARRVGEWLADNGRVPRDPDKVWALVQVWAKWSGDRSQQQTYWNALVEAAQPTSRRRLTLDDHVEAPNGEKVLSGSPWVSPPWMAPPSRSDLVERPELVEELLMALSGAKSADPMAVVAVCGAGGFGKTTLVKQVCQRPEIAEAFPGGLLWTELGQDRQGADLALLLNDLVEQLTRSRPSLSDPQQAGFRLGQVLETQPGPVPLIIDDVWREEQLQPFLMGGRSCQRLVTTRHRLGPLADPITVPVDQMPVGQATSLLTRGVDGIPAAAVDDLLKLTGRWPLLRYWIRPTATSHAGSGATRTLLTPLQRSPPGCARPDPEAWTAPD